MDKRLYLIDGHALVFKMYYAFLRHPMINSKGVDTSILFGFTKYILELIDKEKPTHLAGMRCTLNTKGRGKRLPSL